MKDFFANLAARSLGLARVVRPRTVAIFESIKATDIAAEPSPFQFKQFDVPAAGMHLNNDSPTQPLRIDAASNPLRANFSIPDKKSDVVQPISLQSHNMTTRIEQAVPSPINRIEHPHNDSKLVEMPESIVPKIEVPKQSGLREEEKPKISKQSQTIKATPSRLKTEREQKVSTAVVAEQHKDNFSAVVVNQKNETDYLLIPSKIATLPELPFSGKRESRIDIDSTNQPAIQVTIGRIEVRASTQQTPISTVPRTSSIFTLEEYLQQRGRGEKH